MIRLSGEMMKLSNHMRILSIATLVWFIFLVAGMPDYYLQYSDQTMIIFVILLLLPISIIIYFILRPLAPNRRMTIALWYAFYFTVPLMIYDMVYCGIMLEYSMRYIVVFWFLSVYYIIPWILFPAIAILISQNRSE